MHLSCSPVCLNLPWQGEQVRRKRILERGLAPLLDDRKRGRAHAVVGLRRVHRPIGAVVVVLDQAGINKLVQRLTAHRLASIRCP